MTGVQTCALPILIIPRYSTFVLLNSHLVGFKNKSLSSNHFKTLLVFSVRVALSSAKINMLSMYTIMMHLLIMSPNMSSIIAWNVAGELHNPKNITVGSKSPLFVLKAAFHWSPSLIQTLLYPHQTSNLVNHRVPFSLSSSSIIKGRDMHS